MVRISSCDPEDFSSKIRRVKEKAVERLKVPDDYFTSSDFSKFDSERSIFFLASEKQVVGTCGIRPSSRSSKIAVVKNMHVVPRYQRRGIAQELFDRVLDEADSSSFEYLIAETTSFQEAACRFYEKNGFEIDSENLVTEFDQNFKELRYKRKL